MTLQLANPFVVASCHLTGTKRHLLGLHRLVEKWSDLSGQAVHPGGLVLKSVSSLGGNGLIPNDRTTKRRMWTDYEYDFIRYTDGPKSQELLAIDHGLQLYREARAIWPASVKIGASVLLGEKDSLSHVMRFVSEGVDFVELNTKYLSRRYKDLNHSAPDKASLSFQDFRQQVDDVLANCPCPVWIKFARDLVWLRTKEIIEYGCGISRDDISFVFANTRQINIIDCSLTPDGRAVIWGKSLFAETFDLVRHFRSQLPSSIGIIATGGVTTLRQAAELLDVGASAIQLCAYFHDGEHDLVDWIDVIRRRPS